MTTSSNEAKTPLVSSLKVSSLEVADAMREAAEAAKAEHKYYVSVPIEQQLQLINSFTNLEEDNELLRDESQRLRDEIGGLYARMLRGELVDPISQAGASAESSISSTLAEIRKDVADSAPSSSPMGLFRQHCITLLGIIDSLKAERDMLASACGSAALDEGFRREAAASNMKAAILQRVREHLEQYRPEQYILTQQGSKAVPLQSAIDELATELEDIQLKDEDKNEG